MPDTASAWRRVPEDDAVGKPISEDVRVGLEFGPDSIEIGIRERVREVIQRIVKEELEAALGASASKRVEGPRRRKHAARKRRAGASAAGCAHV
jgi:hypothetical protein